MEVANKKPGEMGKVVRVAELALLRPMPITPRGPVGSEGERGPLLQSGVDAANA